MVNYRGLREDAQSLCNFITSGVLKKIAFERYKVEKGVAVSKVMPGSNEQYRFESENFSGIVDTETRELVNPVYNGTPITANRLSSNPNLFVGISSDLFSELTEIHGDIENMYNEPEMDRSQTESCVKSIKRKHNIVVSDPMLDDLIESIEDKNYLMSAKFLNVDIEESSLLEPGGSHELTELFTEGSIRVVERFRDIALLKPDYRHDVKQNVKSQQAGPGFRVRFQSQPSELAFVVGVDDTPTGLFAHSVDATNLDAEQSVDRDKINDIMGFDRNCKNQGYLSISIGERVRLQGDCAIESLEKSVNNESENIRKLNLPVDNHLCNVGCGYLPEYESRDSEPIEFVVTTDTKLSMRHYEHDDVNVTIPEGKYKIYLLPRGIKDRHPSW